MFRTLHSQLAMPKLSQVLSTTYIKEYKQLFYSLIGSLLSITTTFLHFSAAQFTHLIEAGTMRSLGAGVVGTSVCHFWLLHRAWLKIGVTWMEDGLLACLERMQQGRHSDCYRIDTAVQRDRYHRINLST
jgi:hypothetical protein